MKVNVVHISINKPVKRKFNSIASIVINNLSEAKAIEISVNDGVIILPPAINGIPVNPFRIDVQPYFFDVELVVKKDCNIQVFYASKTEDCI